LRPYRNVADFLREPLDHYVEGRCSAFWVHGPTLAGAVYFGRPDESDFFSLPSLRAVPWCSELRTGYDVILDCSGLYGLSPLSFELLSSQLVEARRDARQIGRVAVIRGSGVPGALVGGLFHELVSPAFRAALFTDLDQALRWLKRPDHLAARADLLEMLERVRGASPLLKALREHLAHHHESTTLDAAARALGLSARSFQRRLRELGTSFRSQLEQTRGARRQTLSSRRQPTKKTAR
jgi:AraC-like DNA-binding protein